MKVLRTILVEDEEASRETLRNYLNKYCEGVEIIEECANIKEGKIAIEKHQPDLVFLDVEMPFGNAFDLLEQIETINFETVFVIEFNVLKFISYSIDINDALYTPIMTVPEILSLYGEIHFGTFNTGIMDRSLLTVRDEVFDGLNRPP